MSCKKGENMDFVSVQEHYDLLVKEGHDPINDPPILKNYMDKWDGQFFINALSLTPSSNVLEIGIGTGRLAKKVLIEGCNHLTGIDISTLSIEQAKLNLCKWENISFITDDFLSHTFSRKFDIIYCSLVFFHINDKKSAISKVSKLLNNSGTFVLSISIDQDTAINYGSIYGPRTVMLFPDDLDETIDLIKSSGILVDNIINTEFAHIIVAKKTYLL